MLPIFLALGLLPCIYGHQHVLSSTDIQPDKCLNKLDSLLRISTNDTMREADPNTTCHQHRHANAECCHNTTPEPLWVTSMQDSYMTSCPDHKYTVRFFSHQPLIIYIENFVSEQERDYLKHAANSRYEQSLTGADYGGIVTDYRTSTTAFLYSDPIADCIRRRAAHFQGLNSTETVEELQVVRYALGQQFKNHHDWSYKNLNPRVSTFFVYAVCDATDPMSSDGHTDSQHVLSPSSSEPSGICQGGATNFPRIKKNEKISTSWCDVIDCDNETRRRGISFKPIPGNAVFWSNIHADGSYDKAVLHAGVPVTSGTKIGLNLWTRRDLVASELEDEEILALNSEHPDAVV